jgi:hypothetical protein
MQAISRRRPTAGANLRHVLQRDDLAQWLFGIHGVRRVGVPLTNPLAQSPLDSDAIALWCASERETRMRRVEEMTLALNLLAAQAGSSPAQDAAIRVVSTAVVDGLRRRFWGGAHDDPAADGCHLGGSDARVYGTLRILLAAWGVLPEGPGVYVCEGDERGPGCGLVFGRPRTPRRRRCDVCQLRPIPWPQPVEWAQWAEPFDAASRVLSLAWRCAEPGCEAVVMWRSDTQGRRPMFCAACSTPAACTARSRRA